MTEVSKEFLLKMCNQFEEMLKEESQKNSIPSPLIYDFAVDLKKKVDEWWNSIVDAGEDVEEYYLGQILSTGTKHSRYYKIFTWNFEGIYEILDYIVKKDYTPFVTYEPEDEMLEKKCDIFQEMLEEDYNLSKPSEKVYTFALDLVKRIDQWREEVEKEGKELNKYWLGQILYAGSRHSGYYYYYEHTFEGLYEVLIYVVETGME